MALWVPCSCKVIGLKYKAGCDIFFNYMSSRWIKSTDPASQTFWNPDSVIQQYLLFFHFMSPTILILKSPMGHVCVYKPIWALALCWALTKYCRCRHFLGEQSNPVWWRMWKQEITTQCVNSVGTWSGWVSGNASRGDMEQVLARSPVGRKDIMGRKHSKCKSKETEKLTVTFRELLLVWLWV